MTVRRLLLPLIGACCLTHSAATAQNDGADYYRSPVGFAITLAGNVGEIRSNHFHTGIDIKALQGVGSPVYAVADGYISRIGVSPTGYGHVLYVTHPNGETSVYGHLNAFAPRIARWVREQQYAKRSFRVDLYPDQSRFPVTKGETIAFLGNTGSSGGPHLHFEIRDAQGRPRNLIADGVYRVADHVPPVVSRILLYEVVSSTSGVPCAVLRQSVPVTMRSDGSAMPADTLLYLAGKGYLAYEVIDYKDGKSNTMGVYALEQRVDGKPNFRFAIDRLDFATTGYVNTFIDYPENRRARRTSVLRCYLSPHNRLALYGTQRIPGSGIISVADTSPRRVVTTVRDDAGNSTVVRFSIARGRALPDSLVPQGKPVLWWRGHTFERPNGEVAIPGSALYESRLIPIGPDTLQGEAVVWVGNSDIPLQRAATVSLAARDLPASLRSKALVVSLDEQGCLSPVGGGWNPTTERVSASTKRLGCFAMAVDTVAPTLRPTYAPGTRIPSGKTLRWRATDDLSGITRYTLTVDGRWELLCWDPKSRTLEHTPQRSETPAAHAVVLTVRDAKGNTNTFKATYTW